MIKRWIVQFDRKARTGPNAGQWLCNLSVTFIDERQAREFRDGLSDNTDQFANVEMSCG